MKREHLREGPEALRSLLKGDFLVIIIRIRTIDIMVDKTLHLLQKLWGFFFSFLPDKGQQILPITIQESFQFIMEKISRYLIIDTEL